MTLYFDPFRELDQLTQQIVSGGRSPRSCPMDAYRRGDEFFVHLDLPGADPSSIDVTVERNALTVRAERHIEFREGDELLVSERPQGIFSRQLSLGATIDTDRIGASYEGGVLTLTLAVSEAAKPRRLRSGPAAIERRSSLARLRRWSGPSQAELGPLDARD